MSSTGLSFATAGGKAAAMDSKPESPSRPEAPSRDERLAAKLRENLRRRKAQARQLEEDGKAALPKGPAKS